MTAYEKGTVLSCGHSGCGCRVVVEVPCHCSGAGKAYSCTCGSEMTQVKK
jgi:hypothetical protein